MVSTKPAVSSERRFPVLLTHHERRNYGALDCPASVPWSFLAPHEKRAALNHGGQSLETLASRGGLGPDEMLAVVENRKWTFVHLPEAVGRLKVALIQQVAVQRLREVTELVARDYPLPRCSHGRALRDHAGAVAAIAREGDDGAGSVVSKPLLKWAGGKRAQLADILPHVRDAISRGTGRLFEPFAGGAAVTLAVGPQGGLLSDALGDLMVLYRIVRDDPQSVHAQMTSLATRGTSKAAYLAVRALRASDPTQAAARLIYLNRVGFNGLYRTNRKGEFNVPHGKRADGRDLEPAWPTMADFASAARALSGVATRVDDWRGAIASTSKGDVIYADPPYEGCFTGYGPKWAVEDFDALAETLHNLAREGRYVIVSQPDAETTRKRYAWCPRIVEIARPKGYAIGGKGARRGATGELLCLGYAPVTRPNQNEVK